MCVSHALFCKVSNIADSESFAVSSFDIASRRTTSKVVSRAAVFWPLAAKPRLKATASMPGSLQIDFIISLILRLLVSCVLRKIDVRLELQFRDRQQAGIGGPCRFFGCEDGVDGSGTF